MVTARHLMPIMIELPKYAERARLMLLLLILLCALWPQGAPAVVPVDVSPDYKHDEAPSGSWQLGKGCFARESADVFLLPDSTTAVHSSLGPSL